MIPRPIIPIDFSIELPDCSTMVSSDECENDQAITKSTRDFNAPNAIDRSDGEARNIPHRTRFKNVLTTQLRYLSFDKSKKQRGSAT
jgi:hypothetical protein